MTSVFRIIDANLNRAGEGLRVVEEFARFALDCGNFSAELKMMRHELRTASAEFSSDLRLDARDTVGDVGVELETATEYQRTSAADVAAASIKRVQQSLRVLEEYGKLQAPAAARRFEQLRYRLYSLERQLFLTFARHERMAGKHLYLLLDGRTSQAEFTSLARTCVEGGADVIQLRDKNLSDRELLQRGRGLRSISADSETLFIMNDRPDLAVLCEADGVHVGQDELSVADVRQIVGDAMLVGVSTHDIGQAREAMAEGADYIGVGPMFASQTKSFSEFPGLAFARQVAAESLPPAFAIGGIDFSNVDELLAVGIKRIAVSGVVLRSENVVETLGRFRSLLREDSPDGQ